MRKNIVIQLKCTDGTAAEHEVDMLAIQDVGVIYDHLTQKYFRFSKAGGNFFSMPIFEEVKSATLVQLRGVRSDRLEKLRRVVNVLNIPSSGHASAIELAETILDALEKVQ